MTTETQTPMQLMEQGGAHLGVMRHTIKCKATFHSGSVPVVAGEQCTWGSNDKVAISVVDLERASAYIASAAIEEHAKKQQHQYRINFRQKMLHGFVNQKWVMAETNSQYIYCLDDIGTNKFTLLIQPGPSCNERELSQISNLVKNAPELNNALIILKKALSDLGNIIRQHGTEEQKESTTQAMTVARNALNLVEPNESN